ncbi:MAG TPA: hypothetical protein VI583_18085 [Cyclobacteriaceae bacterium]|nr:hypothetical protein [Cyclobacteriaceae bacterium]
MNYPYSGNRKFRWRAIIFLPALVLITGLAVMLLWNAILPGIIHSGPINYWQALGILFLCRILFGGFRFFSNPWRRPYYPSMWREKWMNMSEEEKEKFREEWKKRCRQT